MGTMLSAGGGRRARKKYGMGGGGPGGGGVLGWRGGGEGADVPCLLSSLVRAQV